MVATLLLMITGRTPIYMTAIIGATLSAVIAGIPFVGKGTTIVSLINSGLNPVIADMTGVLLFIGIMQSTGFFDVIIRDVIRVGNKLGGGVGVAAALIDQSSIGVRDVAILCPAIVLMGSQLQYMGRCLGVVGTSGKRIPLLMSISVINALIAMLIMNVIV